jgi:hypothetical protein
MDVTVCKPRTWTYRHCDDSWGLPSTVHKPPQSFKLLTLNSGILLRRLVQWHGGSVARAVTGTTGASSISNAAAVSY